MWRLWHRLFGWDYVLYTFVSSCHIRRVRKFPNGVEYVMVFSSTGCIRLLSELEGYNKLTRIT